MNSNANTRSGLRKKTGRKKRAIVLLLLLIIILVVVFQCVRIEVVSSDEDEAAAEAAGARVALPCDPSLSEEQHHQQHEQSLSISSSRRENDDGDDGKARRTSFSAKERLCEDPERVDSLIRSHACETGASGEHLQAQLRAMPGKPSSSDAQEEEETKKSNDDVNDNKNNNIERRIRKKRRKLLNNVEDADPEMENQEMNRVLERFRAGRMRVDGTRNIFHDDDGKAASTMKTYKTCAVVGNSGTLQKTAYGAMIDSAEAVFRVNDGVAKRGCSLYAGSRTTVRVVDAKALGKMEILADDEEEGTTSTTTNSFSRSRNETMVVLVNADEHERETIASSEYFNHAKSVKRVHEDVQDGASVLMHSFREHLAKVGKMQGAGGNVPSMGMITYYLALRLCDFVGLYGFGLYVEKERVENTPSSGKKKSVAPVTAVHDFYRYYDAKRNVELGMRQTHSFDTERMLMSLLSRSNGRSKLCGFKKDGDEDEVTKRIRREQDRRARQLARRTGRGKVKGGSASNSNAASASSESANTGVSVAEEKPIEHTVDWEARLGDSAGSAG
ncbi:unnamed protein product [Bathycoccus prasinos]